MNLFKEPFIIVMLIILWVLLVKMILEIYDDRNNLSKIAIGQEYKKINTHLDIVIKIMGFDGMNVVYTYLGIDGEKIITDNQEMLTMNKYKLLSSYTML